MEIKFLQGYEETNCTLIDENQILEKGYQNSPYDMVDYVKYYIYDTNTNERMELLPKLQKLNAFRIVDAQYQSDHIYFTQYLDTDQIIHIIRYNVKDGIAKKIYTIKENLEDLLHSRDTTFFILNENALIIESRSQKDPSLSDVQGYYSIEATLYMIQEKKSFTIVDENFIHNGISDMFPLSENKVLVKLGFDLLSEKRYEHLKKTEASVESINIVNVSQFISDLTLQQTGLVLDSIDQTYFTQTIPRICVEDNFIIYTKVDLDTFYEYTYFYDYETKDRYCCLNKNFRKTKKYTKAQVIGEKPYVRMDKTQKKEFFNLKSKKIDFSIENAQQINAILGDLIVITEEKKLRFNRVKEYINIYRYPTMDLLYSEKGSYRGSLYNRQTDTLIISVADDN